MTPEAERFFQNAHDHLERGQIMLATELDEDAGRAAYLAAFHAAQAVIFERTGKILKTHKGVQIEFLRLTKDDPRFTPEQRRFFPAPMTSKLSPTTTAGLFPKFHGSKPLMPWKQRGSLLLLSGTCWRRRSRANFNSLRRRSSRTGLKFADAGLLPRSTSCNAV